MHPLIRAQNVYHYWRPWAPKLYDIPGEGQRLDEPPVVSLLSEAGNVTTGTHRYKIAIEGGTSGKTKCGDPSRTITTDTASAGKVAITIGTTPSSRSVSLYRTEAGGTTYKLVAAGIACSNVWPTVYIDNVADGALGADEPASNNASPAINDPPIVADIIAALTAGEDTDYLVAYWVLGYRWTLMAGAGNNTLLLVPGSYTGTQAYPLDPYLLWEPTDTPVAAISIPEFSSDWAAMEALLDAAEALDFPVTIEYGSATAPNDFQVTCEPAGATAISLAATTKADLPLNVCKVLLTAVFNVDWT